MADENKERSWKDRIGDLLFENDHLPGEEEQTTPRLSGTGGSGAKASAAPAVVPEPAGDLNLSVIYQAAGIQDEEFATPEQVLELRATFADLPAEVQHQKVLRTLGSFKVDVQQVVSNTQAKMAAIEGYVADVRSQGVTTIDTSNQTIEELQQQIDACKRRIIETQTLLDKVTRDGESATARLRSVLQFLGQPADDDAAGADN